MSQADAAKHLGIGFTSYQRLEAGGHIRFMIDASDLGSIRDISQIIGEVSKPTRAEMCTLARRRSGLKLEEIAACLGTTHVTILKLERTADPKIVRFWVDEGYNFGPTEDFIETMEEEQIA
jgi:DNA-binding XRE family transcriptional regulator